MGKRTGQPTGRPRGRTGGNAHNNGVSDVEDLGLEEGPRQRQRDREADEAFQQLLAAAGAVPGVHTEPQTSRPRTIAPEVMLRSASRWLLPAGDPLVG